MGIKLFKVNDDEFKGVYQPIRTLVFEPIVHKTTCSRPSLKHKPFKDNRVDAPIEDLYWRSYLNMSKLGLSSTKIHEPLRHSSYVD